MVEYRRSRPTRERRRAAVSSATSRAPAAHQRLGARRGRGPVVRTSSTRSTRRGTRGAAGGRRTRRASRRDAPSPARRACGARRDRALSSRATGRSQPAADGAGERPRLVVARARPAAVATSGTHVIASAAGRTDRRPSRRRARRRRAASPENFSRWMARRPGPSNRNGDRATTERRRRAVVAASTASRAGRAAPLAPRWGEHDERGAAADRRTARDPSPQPAHRGGNSDVERPSDHGATLAATADIRGRGYGSVELRPCARGSAARHRSSASTASACTGYAVTRPATARRRRPPSRAPSSAVPSAASRTRSAPGGVVAHVTRMDSPRTRPARRAPSARRSTRAFASTVTLPRRTVARGHGTANRFGGRTFSGVAVDRDVARPARTTPASSSVIGDLERDEHVAVRRHVERRPARPIGAADRAETDRRTTSPRRSRPGADRASLAAQDERALHRARGTARSAPGPRRRMPVAHRARSGALLPRAQVLLLLGRQRVDLDAHRRAA